MKHALAVRTLTVGSQAANCYLICDAESHSALVVDPADAPEYISDVLTREGLHPIGLLATHGHFDHIMAAFGLQLMYDIPFYIHPDDNFLVARMRETAVHFLHRKNIDPAPVRVTPLKDKQTIVIGERTAEILHVPGHTPGSVAVHVPDAQAILVGDCLFADGSVGSTNTSYGKALMLSASIKRILDVPSVAMLYPGHGEGMSHDRAKIIFGV